MKLTSLPTPVPFDGGMLIAVGEDRLLAYNSTAYFIWRALVAGCSNSEIASTLTEAFGIDPGVAAAHVDAILRHWRAEGLLGGAFNAVPQARHAGDRDLPRLASGWAARWTCQLGGRCVEFAVEDAGAAEFLRAPLRLLASDAGIPETFIEVRVDGSETWAVLRDGVDRRRVAGREGLKEAVYQTLIEFLWADSPIAALIHAGTVIRGRTGLCLPARSGSGKSTLVAYLCGRGFLYATDDLTALTESGEVLPLPVPINLKKGSWDLMGHMYPQLSSNPAFPVGQTFTRLVTPPCEWRARPTHIGALVFPKYERDAVATLQPIRPSETLVRLQEAGVWIGHPLTEDRIAWFAAWLEQTPAYALTYDNLSDAAGRIDSLFEADRL